MKRRRFIQQLLQTATVAGTADAFSTSRVLGANDRVQVALIGCGGRGMLVAKLMQAVPGVEVAAVCDVYDQRALAAQAWAGPGCKTFRDFRRVLELPQIDAVLIATPDHWHAIPTVLACQAGKDIYVEKPLAHNIAEGQAMVKAARDHNRVVQVGLQQRSAPHYAEATRIIQSGGLGRVAFVREYSGFVLSYEASMLKGHGAAGRTPGKKYYQARGADDHPHGEGYYGTNGTLIVDRLGFEIFPEMKSASGPGAAAWEDSTGLRMERQERAAEDATELHEKNFIECVRSRQKPVADIQTGHHSTNVAHLGNIAYRTNRKIRWDGAREEIMGDPDASILLRRGSRKPWDLI
ncbi:MAG: Gfo/Idh/MocA family protein [Verrucomicrobiia bacterium]